MSSGARVVAGIAVSAVVACAVGAAFTDGELEPTLLMVGAVITALACFDRSLDRRSRSLWPWLLLSLGVLGKVIPSVIVELAAEGSLSFERYDQLGSVLAGASFAVVMYLLARPAGARAASIATLVILSGGVMVATAGATMAFAYDPGYLGERAARFAETSGWGIAGLIASAAALAVAITPRLGRSALALIAIACAAASVLGLASSGRSIDVAVWLGLWAALTFSAFFLAPTPLGDRDARTFGTLSSVLVVVLMGLFAAAAALWSRLDDSTWDPGWIVLVAVAALLLLLAIAAALDKGGDRGASSRSTEGQRDRAAVEPGRTAASVHQSLDPRAQGALGVPVSVASSVPGEQGASVSVASSVPGEQGASVSVASSVPAEQGAPVSVASSVPGTLGSPVSVVSSAPGAQGSPVAAASPAEINVPIGEPAHKVHLRIDSDDPEPNIRPSVSRLARSLEPHHHDPQTGLLSAAGLQEIVQRVFTDPHREPGDVALLMIALRNGDQIESEYGRIAMTHVNKTIAERLSAALPHAACARFSRMGFAAILGDQGEDPPATIELFTESLIALLDEVEFDGRTIPVDVVGGMAQSYSDEEATGLVQRANLGLEQAVRSAEPTLVSMP